MRGLGSKVFCGGSGISIYRGDSGPMRQAAGVVENVLLAVCAQDVHLCNIVTLRDIANVLEI